MDPFIYLLPTELSSKKLEKTLPRTRHTESLLQKTRNGRVSCLILLRRAQSQSAHMLYQVVKCCSLSICITGS